jgi:CRISPR-associated exonuclease Cas4
MQTEHLFEVSDLKQWAYCPRVVYYRYCLPDIRPITDLMQAGQRSHEDEASREERRSLNNYGLKSGTRHYDLIVSSPTLQLSARIDLLITQPDQQPNKALVVEYKDSERADSTHFKIQLTAYALLIEEVWGLQVPLGYIYNIPQRKAQAVPISPSLRNKTLQIIQQLSQTVIGERMPDAPAKRAKCVDCEFRRFCNDVI